MYALKHHGNGFTICAGCLGAGRYPSHWDSMITEVFYESGEVIGCFCNDCLANAKENYNIKEGVIDEKMD